MNFTPGSLSGLILADDQVLMFCYLPRSVRRELRADNAKMIGYMQTLGYYREKEFDFPHKRTAPMAIRRERFFDSGVLC